VIAAAWGAPGPHWPDDPSVHAYAITCALTATGGGERDHVVGFVQWAEETDPQYRHAGIDIFVDPDRHGRGIGTQAVRLLVGHLVAERGHHRIVIDPAADNAAAIACYRRAGFLEVGVMRAYEQGPDGRFHDGLLMEYVHRDEGGSP
jgi:aminoglycoside 6'-N-acetyltransferase